MIQKYHVGQKVIVSIPRDDIDHKYNGRVGTIKKINLLVKNSPDYKLDFGDGTGGALNFLETDLEPVDSLTESHYELVCPECGCNVMSVNIPDNNQDVKVIIFKCMFSVTVNANDKVEEIQKKMIEAKKSGKLKSFGIKGD